MFLFLYLNIQKLVVVDATLHESENITCHELISGLLCINLSDIEKRGYCTFMYISINVCKFVGIWLLQKYMLHNNNNTL